MSKNTSGRFVWHDLMTTDVKASLAFYTELFAWKTREVEMGKMGKYTMISAGDRDIGGIVHLDPKHGAPAHWIAYCTVPDVDAAAKRATELGGKVAVPATDIPGVGRFAVLEDPQGGHLSPFKSNDEAAEDEGPPPVGIFCWDELVTSDPAAALKFYEPIFGWKHDDKDMGPMGTYHVLKRGERMSGGIMKNPMPEAKTAWLAYVAVASVDESAKRAESLKAKTVVPPSDIPGIGRFAVIQDPVGAVVALFQV
jgi:predicted enzyme related to lactoylglutathione lyase